jgi:hypothetical protein
MAYSKSVYQKIADELNQDFRTILHADATDVGISIVTKCPLDVRRLAANIEFSRVIQARAMSCPMTITVTDYGIICIR